MPRKPKRPCPGRGPRRTICRNLIDSNERCCPECAPYDKWLQKKYDQDRGNSAERGYDAAWRKVRELKLSQDPLCQMCLDEDNHIKSATMVHHIKPIETHPELRLDMDNLMSLCNRHHEEIEKCGRWGR